ncbi:hypothetical protein PPYR_12179 [Photinus pyralis]|uniref:F-box domain-containing protein n=1 Tax=Photinus pyralis TaxID=7054 RepID=A0A5N4ADD5_PHOPY|nr:uncharacterized protein LOC116177459 [Photinus pyralis]KAB0795340.1 hypothetical protein PPYR_12179 [Photinus pyralis]
MIHSSTRMFNELEETRSISSSACQKQNAIQSKKYVTQLMTRFNAMQGWFIRCSRIEKVKTLSEMLRLLKSINSLSTLLSLLMTIYESSYTYASLEASINFVYDKSLNDHNRAMHTPTLKKVQNADLEWFANLSEESEQTMILIGLLRLGGGAVLYQIYRRGVSLYHEVVSNTRLGESHSAQLINRRKSRSFSDWPLVDMLISPQNKENPAKMEVEQCTKIWNDAMKQYRPLPKKSGADQTKDGKKNKKEKGKSAKKTKTGKETKGGKKTKKGNDDDGELDWIQLCPIWIVKKIFGYLDAKTLKKIVGVNKYWKAAVNDFQADLKSRKLLKKFIVKFEKGTPAGCEIVPKRAGGADPTTKKRLKRLWERGAASPKINAPFQKHAVEIPAVVDFQEWDKYILDMRHLKMFPRCLWTYEPTEHSRPIENRRMSYASFTRVPSNESHSTALQYANNAK